ncbi:hypothetical protein KXX40_008449 [Aspergillus fumigatus]|nr:hypothetical protein KXX40_008449 [Aspergillus fumigatus]
MERENNSQLHEINDVQSHHCQSHETIQQPSHDRGAIQYAPKQYSLTGSNRPSPYHGGVYLHPDYMHYNPNYGQPQNAPVWTTDKRPNAHQEEVPAADEPPTEHPAHNADLDAEKNQPEARVSQPDERGFFNKWGEIRHRFREPLAEWLGTTVAMTLGLCAGLQTYTSQNQAGSFSSLAPAWGFAFMVAIYTAGGVSGGHLNPAITISMAVWRGFPARKCMVYVAAQIVGSIPAGGIAYALYHDAIVDSALANHVTQGECFNGARDFGPRLVALMAGWEGEVFREKHVWWIWGPWAADITGGLFGTFIYDLAIFTGAEGPIDYPRRRRKRALLIKEKNQMVELRY